MTNRAIKFFCYWCGASEHDARLVAGPAGVAICAGCISRCVGELARTDKSPGTRELPKAPVIGDLDPAFRALIDGEISMGRMREIIHLWLAREPWNLPPEQEPLLSRIARVLEPIKAWVDRLEQDTAAKGYPDTAGIGVQPHRYGDGRLTLGDLRLARTVSDQLRALIPTSSTGEKTDG